MVLRNWIIALLVLTALVSCSDEVIERGGEFTSSIRFATLMTKGEAITDVGGLAHAGGFNVWAISHTGSWGSASNLEDLLANKRVTSKDSVNWVYDTPVEWPQSGNVSFFAYAPAGSATVESPAADGTPRIRYVVPLDGCQQPDLLIAEDKHDQTITNYYGGKPVNLHFNHALSKIGFSALMVNGSNRKTQVKKIELRNLYRCGTTGLDAINWTLDTPFTYTLEIEKGLLDLQLTTTSQEISADSCFTFLLPQPINRSDNPIEMAVTLLIDGGETTYTAPVFSPEAWLPGKSYNYQIAVDHNSIQVIEIGSGTTELIEWNSSIIVQSVVMPNAIQWTDNSLVNDRFYTGLANLDTLKSKAGYYSWFNYKYFGLYATHDLHKSITLTMPDKHSFVAGDYVIFDFKKAVEEWKEGAVVRISDPKNEWELSPAFQDSPRIPVEKRKTNVDGSTGATLPLAIAPGDTIYPSNVITTQGAIIFKKK